MSWLSKLFILCLGFFISTSSFAVDEEKIGSLRNVTDSGLIKRASDNSTLAAVEGMEVYQNDMISTDAKGSLGIIFIDGTRISLGTDSKLVVSKYVFKPSQKKYSMLTRMMKGTASFVSGKLSKLAPDSVKIKTPDATIGSRGTSFLIKVEAQ